MIFYNYCTLDDGRHLFYCSQAFYKNLIKVSWIYWCYSFCHMFWERRRSPPFPFALFFYFPPQFLPHPLFSLSFSQQRAQISSDITSDGECSSSIPPTPPPRLRRLTTLKPITQSEGSSHTNRIWRPIPRATTNELYYNASLCGLVWRIERLWSCLKWKILSLILKDS